MRALFLDAQRNAIRSIPNWFSVGAFLDRPFRRSTRVSTSNIPLLCFTLKGNLQHERDIPQRRSYKIKDDYY